MSENTYDNVETHDLLVRYSDLLHQYASCVLDVSPRLEKIGKIRGELQLLAVELLNRQETPANLETDEAKIQTEIDKLEQP